MSSLSDDDTTDNYVEDPVEQRRLIAEFTARFGGKETKETNSQLSGLSGVLDPFAEGSPCSPCGQLVRSQNEFGTSTKEGEYPTMTTTSTTTKMNYAEFKRAYLAHPDAEEASNDNETPELMEARCLRVWNCFSGDMEEAIRKADQLEAVVGAGGADDDTDDESESSSEGEVDPRMEALLESVFTEWRAKGIRCEEAWECCMTCGHAAMEGTQNYVFYHDQDDYHLKDGDTDVHLCFDLTDEGKKVVLETCRTRPDEVHWAGADHTRIYLTCDPEQMRRHKADDAERQVRMAARTATRTAE